MIVIGKIIFNLKIINNQGVDPKGENLEASRSWCL